MKLKRRNFIKQGFGFLAAFVLIPSSVFGEKPNTYSSKRLKNSRKPEPESWSPDDFNVAWIGHSTVLMNLYGKIILTDPVLFERIGLYFFGLTFGPGRFSAPALDVDEIPKPDIILLSHAHLDHMDYKSLLYLTNKFPGEINCVTAFNTKDVIEELKWRSLKEIDWGEDLEIEDIKFSAIEVKHFGWRYPWEKDRSRGYFKDGRSFNAYLIEKNGLKILFGGDTAYTKKFMEAKLNIDVAIMPIGAYNPWRMNHCNPEEALIMASYHMKTNYFVPIHCSTFKQGNEPVNEPLEWLVDSAKHYQLKVGIKKIGETFTFPA